MAVSDLQILKFFIYVIPVVMVVCLLLAYFIGSRNELRPEHQDLSMTHDELRTYRLKNYFEFFFVGVNLKIWASGIVIPLTIGLAAWADSTTHPIVYGALAYLAAVSFPLYPLFWRRYYFVNTTIKEVRIGKVLRRRGAPNLAVVSLADDPDVEKHCYTSTEGTPFEGDIMTALERPEKKEALLITPDELKMYWVKRTISQ